MVSRSFPLKYTYAILISMKRPFAYRLDIEELALVSETIPEDGFDLSFYRNMAMHLFNIVISLASAKVSFEPRKVIGSLLKFRF